MAIPRVLNAATHLTALMAILAGGCGAEKSNSTVAPPAVNVPTMPTSMPGQASLGGHVLDANGQGVQGAVVKIAETDQTANSDVTGAYEIAVPSDSTLTLTAAAAGMANTFRESVVLAVGSVVSDFDVLLLTSGQMNTINTVGQSGQPSTRGVVAVRLHSTDSACVTAGAHVTVFPPSAATVLYSAPASGGGALDMPDPTIQEVQPDTQIAVWLTAALPPGNMNLLRIDVQRDGCQLLAQSPSLGGLLFPGRREVAPNSLTEADLFFQ